jgi:hypothetical protein
MINSQTLTGSNLSCQQTVCLKHWLCVNTSKGETAVPCFELRVVACQNIWKASLFKFRQYNKWQSVHVWKAQRKQKWLHLPVQKSFQRQMIENPDIPTKQSHLDAGTEWQLSFRGKKKENTMNLRSINRSIRLSISTDTERTTEEFSLNSILGIWTKKKSFDSLNQRHTFYMETHMP